MRLALSKSILLKHLNRCQNFSTISFSLGSVLWYKIFGGLRLEVPLDSRLMLIECWAMILEVLLDSRLTLIECWAMELEVRLDSRLMLIECSAMGVCSSRRDLKARHVKPSRKRLNNGVYKRPLKDPFDASLVSASACHRHPRVRVLVEDIRTTLPVQVHAASSLNQHGFKP